MCGRFAQTSSAEELVELFGLTAKPHVVPHYNIAPTQPIVVIRKHADDHHAHTFRWGLVPSWAQDIKIGQKMFNARSESVFHKRSFSMPARHQRCIIPATGFYEWRDTPGGKMPTLFRPKHGPIFCFAGLWSSWMDPTGTPVYSATILTVDANPTMNPFHHRMPVLLEKDAHQMWLDTTISNPKTLAPLLKTAPCSALALHPVSKRVNNVRHDDPKCWDNATSSM